jgi:hypothetical protein
MNKTIDIFCALNEPTYDADSKDWQPTEGQPLDPSYKEHALSYVDQFIILYHSVKENWKNVNYNMNVLHSAPLSDETIQKFKKIDINIIKVDPFLLDVPWLIRTEFARVDSKADYRLYLDVDMIALNEPKFEFVSDFYLTPVGWSGVIEEEYEMIKDLGFSIQHPNASNWSHPRHLCNNRSLEKEDQLYLDSVRFKKENVFPHFNGGSVMIKNDQNLTRKFYEEWWYVFLGAKKFLESQKLPNVNQKTYFSPIAHSSGSLMAYYPLFQAALIFADGLAVTKITDDWDFFDIGINYFDNLLHDDEFTYSSKHWEKMKDKISLYHYCYPERARQGINGFDKYFNKAITEETLGAAHG